MIDYLKKILNKINEYKDRKDVLEVLVDMDAVKYMFNNGYNKYKVNEINQKYINEITFLRNIEIKIYPSDPISNNNPEIQTLKNLYYVLIKIAVLRVLKLNNKQFNEEKLISREYKDVYELLKDI